MNTEFQFDFKINKIGNRIFLSAIKWYKYHFSPNYVILINISLHFFVFSIKGIRFYQAVIRGSRKLILNLYTEEFFNAAHLLCGYDGKCSQMHGHTWKICVWIRGDESSVDDVGILWDFNNLKKIIDRLDHKYLNEVLNNNPSVENLTLFVYKELKNGSPALEFKIRIYESIIKRESYCEAGDF